VRTRSNVACWIAAVAVSLVVFAQASMSAEKEAAAASAIRRGAVGSVVVSGLHVYITAADADGEPFHVVSETCAARAGDRIEVVEADHYDSMNIPPLGGAVRDVYLAQLLRLNNREVIASRSKGVIPQGCSILER